jgi:hypothetical protein
MGLAGLHGRVLDRARYESTSSRYRRRALWIPHCRTHHFDCRTLVAYGTPVLFSRGQERLHSSKTEGEDKPLKYPTIFNSADVAIVTKVDLAAAVEFSWETAYDNVQAVRPGMPEFKLSAKTGQGMEEHLKFLAARLIEVRLMELVEIKGVPKKQKSC